MRIDAIALGGTNPLPAPAGRSVQIPGRMHVSTLGCICGERDEEGEGGIQGGRQVCACSTTQARHGSSCCSTEGVGGLDTVPPPHDLVLRHACLQLEVPLLLLYPSLV